MLFILRFCDTEKPRVEFITVEMATDILFNRNCLLAVPSEKERHLQKSYK